MIYNKRKCAIPTPRRKYYLCCCFSSNNSTYSQFKSVLYVELVTSICLAVGQ